MSDGKLAEIENIIVHTAKTILRVMTLLAGLTTFPSEDMVKKAEQWPDAAWAGIIFC